MNKFPDCFPENFESEILPNNAEYKKYNAYRILKHGILNHNEFLSTFEEFKDSKYKPRGYNPLSAETYSTSVFSSVHDAKSIMKLMCRHYPHPSLAEGTTEPCCGPCLKEYNSSHINWWIFKDSLPENFFKVVEQNE